MGILGYDDGEIRFPWAKQADEAERRPPVPPSLAMSAVALSHSIWPDQDISYAEDPGVRRPSEQSWVLSSSAPGPSRFAPSNGTAGPEGLSRTTSGVAGPPPRDVPSTAEPSSSRRNVDSRQQLVPKLEPGAPPQPFYPAVPSGLSGMDRHQLASGSHYPPAAPYHPPPPHSYGSLSAAHHLPPPIHDPARSAHLHLPHFPMGSAPPPQAYPYAPMPSSSGLYFDPAAGRYPPSAHYPYPARPQLPSYPARPQLPSYPAQPPPVDEVHRLQPIAPSGAQPYRPPPAAAPPSAGQHRPTSDRSPLPSPVPLSGPPAPIASAHLALANVPPDVKPTAVKRALSKKGKPSSMSAAAASTSAAAAAEASAKRRRTLIACDRCRAHKLRCLGGRPCPACDKRGAGAECTYVAEVRRRGKAKKSRQAGQDDAGDGAAGGSDPDRAADGLVPMDDVGSGGGGGDGGGRGRTSDDGDPLSPRTPPVQVVDFAQPHPAPSAPSGKRYSPTYDVSGRARESVQSDGTTDGSGSGSSRTTGSVSSAAGSVPHTPAVGSEGAAQDGPRGLIDRLKTTSVAVD